jgi:hypothetical protein
MNVTSPIHEIGHLLAAWSEGSGARLTGWTSTNVEIPSPTIYTAGHYFEGIIYTFLVLVLAKRKIGLASFIFGLNNNNLIYGVYSDDFKIAAESVGDGVFKIWSAFNFIILTLGWIVMIMAFRKRAKILRVSDSGDKCPAPILAAAKKATVADRKEANT